MPELDTAPADSALDGTEALLTLGFEHVPVQKVRDWNETKSSNIPSAATTDIGAATSRFVHVTGTTTITGLGTVQAGTNRVVVFDGALTLTHNSTSLILPTGANITTAAGDCASFMSEGSGNWKCVGYTRANGTPLAGGGGGGDVVGPASSVDNTLPRYDSTTGKFLQGSGVAVDDNNAISGYVGLINAQTGTTYTLVATDAGKIVTLSNASSITLTLPNSLPAGWACTVIQKGAGQVTFTAGSGATRNNRSSHTKAAGQWAMCTLYVDSNSGGSSAVYVLGGDTAA